MVGGKGKQITLRVQAPEGARRVEIPVSASTKDLYELIQRKYEFSCCAFMLHKDKSKKQLIASSKSQTVASSALGQGDTLYLTPEPGMGLTPVVQQQDEPMDETPSPAVSQPSTSNADLTQEPPIVHARVADVKEDPVDVELSEKNGLIPRGKDPRYCKHGENAGCVYCCPLPPYDEAYLKEHNIKHLSFHSYLRKWTSGDKGKFAPLEDLSVRIKEGCPTHPPWPKGICSKCQPSAVTLNRQEYRHVDSVIFENPTIVEQFFSYWRTTGFQRVGLLYGTYEEHSDVPLGIRARVAAIYEPVQESTRDGILNFSMDADSNPALKKICEGLGLRCVGWIYTDLIPDDISKGTVKHLRGGHSFFLSAQECITAAAFQHLHPNYSRQSPTGQLGRFGSKFATIIVTGDDKNQVHMEGYQVSNQCMALVRDDCLVPTKDAPELAYVKESSNRQYVPDVYYKHKDEYGNEVTKIARPLPVEYLLVDVPVSTPKAPLFTFNVFPDGKTKTFPIENRPITGHIQHFPALGNYLNQFSPETPFLKKACDFHFLVYIATMECVSLLDHMDPLLEAIKTQNATKADEWANSELWATVDQLIDAAGGENGMIDDGHSQNAVSPQRSWTCAHCTFHNVGNHASCDVCQLPRN